jgi:hypothetical protein
LPLEFYSPEAFGFLSIFGLPHLVLARALMLFGLSYYLLAVDTRRNGWIAVIFFLGLTFVQPLSVLSAYAVIAVHQALLLVRAILQRNWRHWIPWFSTAVRSGVPALPVVVYLGYSFTRDPFLRNWTAQNRILSPHPMHYLLAYGLLLIPAIMGARRLFKHSAEKGFLPIGWVASLPLLAYAPYNLQRRLPEGVWVAIVLLALIGVSTWVGDRAPIRLWVVRACFVVLCLSSLLLLVGGIRVILSRRAPVFRPAKEVHAFQSLSYLAEDRSVVLTSYHSGNALPAWTPLRVVVGHGPESIDLNVLLPQVEGFYNGTIGKTDAIRFLAEQQVRYVWVGPEEKALGFFDPEDFPELTELFQEGEYTVYQYQADE